MGDIQFGNDYTVRHTRTGFEEWLESERRCILWRLWLMEDSFRRCAPDVNQWFEGVHQLNVTDRIKLIYEVKLPSRVLRGVAAECAFKGRNHFLAE